MTNEELLINYPRATNIVKQWYKEKMIEALDDEMIPEEFKTKMLDDKLISDETIIMILDVSPRMLFDLFDANHVHIEIGITTSPVQFIYSVNHIQNIEDKFSTRKEADLAAVIRAFELVNCLE
jgi:hypothetical protein